ncbi:uncharacterized protein LOC135383021 [Ornithodoros turicata]|uniref:uncharacterized protein LOC135383021 n=1 Tax=Ornithodoros turicata TaxID=34597 RepID=UPI003139EA8B
MSSTSSTDPPHDEPPGSGMTEESQPSGAENPSDDPALFSVQNFDPPPSLELVCTICRGVFRHPVELPCRHVFCRSCISQWLERQSSCPNCRHEAAPTSVIPALPLVANLIASLQTRCPHGECQEKMTLETLQRHILTCEWRQVKCPDCNVSFRADHFQSHHTNECPKRLIRCTSHCGFDVRAEDMPGHNCITEMKRRLAELQEQRDQLTAQLEEAQRRIQEMQNELYGLRRWISEMGVDPGGTSVPAPQLFVHGTGAAPDYWYPVPFQVQATAMVIAPATNSEEQVALLHDASSGTSYSQQGNFGSSTAPLLRQSDTVRSSSTTSSTTQDLSTSRITSIMELEVQVDADSTGGSSDRHSASPHLMVIDLASQDTVASMSVCPGDHVRDVGESSAMSSVSNQNVLPSIKPRVKFNESGALERHDKEFEMSQYGSQDRQTSQQCLSVDATTAGSDCTTQPPSEDYLSGSSATTHFLATRRRYCVPTLVGSRSSTVEIAPEARPRVTLQRSDVPLNIRSVRQRSRNLVNANQQDYHVPGPSSHTISLSISRSFNDGHVQPAALNTSEESNGGVLSPVSTFASGPETSASSYGYLPLMDSCSEIEIHMAAPQREDGGVPLPIDGICVDILEMLPLVPGLAGPFGFSASSVSEVSAVNRPRGTVDVNAAIDENGVIETDSADRQQPPFS